MARPLAPRNFQVGFNLQKVATGSDEPCNDLRLCMGHSGFSDFEVRVARTECELYCISQTGIVRWLIDEVSTQCTYARTRSVYITVQLTPGEADEFFCICWAVIE